MATEEWVEISKKPGTGGKTNVPREGVMFGVNKAPRAGIYAKVFIGAAVATKLRWTAGSKLRLRWSAGGALRLKIDIAPAGHRDTFELRAVRAKASDALYIATSALPEAFVREGLVAKVTQHEVIADFAGARTLGELIIRLPAECYVVGKRHAA